MNEHIKSDAVVTLTIECEEGGKKLAMKSDSTLGDFYKLTAEDGESKGSLLECMFDAIAYKLDIAVLTERGEYEDFGEFKLPKKGSIGPITGTDMSPPTDEADMVRADDILIARWRDRLDKDKGLPSIKLDGLPEPMFNVLKEALTKAGKSQPLFVDEIIAAMDSPVGDPMRELLVATLKCYEILEDLSNEDRIAGGTERKVK